MSRARRLAAAAAVAVTVIVAAGDVTAGLFAAGIAVASAAFLMWRNRGAQPSCSATFRDEFRRGGSGYSGPEPSGAVQMWVDWDAFDRQRAAYEAQTGVRD